MNDEINNKLSDNAEEDYLNKSEVDSEQITKVCTNCGQEYEVFDDEPMCPYCGYIDADDNSKSALDEDTDSDITTAICESCGQEYEVFDDEPMCPYCGYIATEKTSNDDDLSTNAHADKMNICESVHIANDNAECQTVQCTNCGEEYEIFDDSPICPYCGFEYNEIFDEISDNKTDAVYDIEPEDKTDAVYDIEPEDKTGAVYDIEPEDKTDAIYDIEPEDKTDAVYDIEPEDKTDAVYDIEPEDKTGAIYDIEPEDKTGAIYDIEPEDKTGAIYDIEPEDKTDAIYDIEPEDKTDAIYDIEPEVQGNIICNLNRQDSYSDISYNEIDRCLGCLEEIGDSAECPHCGYKNGQLPDEPYYMVPGTILDDRYIIGKALGSGGFGVTYIGWDTKLFRKVAIKEYMPGEFATRVPGKANLTIYSGEKGEQFEIGKNKFKDEAQRLAKCNDISGVVKIFDVISKNNTSYIIMELLEGETLKDRLNREGTLSVDDSLAIILPVLDSLEQIHKHGLIHRDIAPDNIYLCNNGEVKIFDFGAARYATTNYSKSLSVILKSGYAPEEQYRSHGEQGTWSDIYAASATLYKMLTGVTPPDAMERVANDELRASIGMPGWIVSADKKYKHIKVAIANRLYKMLTGKNAEDVNEIETADFEKLGEENRNEKRERLAVTTYKRLTGTIPGTSNFHEESYVADDVIKSIPKNINNAMINALNVYKDERTQTANDFKEELTSEKDVKLLPVKNRKGDLGDIPKWMKVTAAFCGIIVAALLTSVVMIIIGLAKTDIYTPEIINMMTDEAEQEIIDSDLEYMIVDSQISDKVTENKVMLQEPYAGTVIEKGSVVKATISIGPEKVSVPNFIGMSKSDADKLLEELGIKAEYTEDYSSIAKGKICAQSADYDSRIAVDSTIKLTVSLGLENVDTSKKVKLPKLVDMSIEAAQKKLEAMNLYISIQSQQYSDKAAGTILSQSVKAGESVKEGTTIKVTVSKGKKTVIVPYVTYKTESEAIKLLQAKGLKYGIKYEYHDTVAKGNVISQSVKAESKVAPGTNVSLVVSKGKKTVIVPNVVGQTTSSAMQTIKEKGLQVKVTEEHSDKVAAGTVIRQTPAAKKEVDNNSTVTIIVSKGKESVSVPNVSGQSAQDASAALESKGLNVEITEQYSDTVVSGNVISQSPSSGSSLPKGSTVTLVVSKGKQPVTVPNVVGKSSSSATSTLTGLGLKVSTKESYSDSVASGNVISQSPGSGNVVYKGSTVTLEVSKGPQPVTVPDVVGKTSSNASSTLTNVGLKVSVKEVYSDTVAKGYVISQNPSGNASAHRNDTVTITVSKGKEPITIPNVVGKSSASAQNTITSLGLKVKVVEGYSDNVTSGNVAKQSPSASSTCYKGDTVTITVSKGKSTYSDWSTSLPSGVSESNGYQIESKTQYRSRSISTKTVTGDWQPWSSWSESRQSTNENKKEESKTQYRYYRFVCPNCGADWYGRAKCMSCGKADYLYGSSDWGAYLIEDVHYMWYDLPKESILWSKATADNTAIRAKLGTNKYWYYYNNGPEAYYWSRTVYRYSTREVTTSTVYGEWREWSDSKITSSDSLLVETRTVYRYRVKPVD